MVSSGACLGGDAYDHLLRLGFVPRSPTMKKSGEAGPDFCIVSQEQTIWIEAVTRLLKGYRRVISVLQKKAWYNSGRC